jgi:hypothetical protein
MTLLHRRWSSILRIGGRRAVARPPYLLRPHAGRERFHRYSPGNTILNLRPTRQRAVHGLAGDVKEANTYYDDVYGAVGAFDFVMANPPFNVGLMRERVAQ